MTALGARWLAGNRGEEPLDDKLRSCLCTQRQLESKEFQNWAAKMQEPLERADRKLWEWCFITQALHERGMLSPGKRGLGFAVGQEPLADLFASMGCEIVATDLCTEEAKNAGWTSTDQHARSLEVLNKRGICPPETFKQRASFQFLDMKALPDDLGRFDFIWSSCSLEHLGTMALGERFLLDSIKYLKPGGVSVHTTEFNLSSRWSTVTDGPVVLFRKKDVQRIASKLRESRHQTELDFRRGHMPLDRVVARPPYGAAPHFNLLLYNEYVVTSFGMIIESEDDGGARINAS